MASGFTPTSFCDLHKLGNVLNIRELQEAKTSRDSCQGWDSSTLRASVLLWDSCRTHTRGDGTPNPHGYAANHHQGDDHSSCRAVNLLIAARIASSP